MKKRVYVSGALTNSGRREFYEKIGEVVSELGYEPYIPHLHTDPVKNPDVSPKEVYRIDKERVQSSSLIIAYVGEPSLGVGAELEMASEKGIPIILLYEKTAKVSRLARGIPSSRTEITYISEVDALRDLKEVIKLF